MILFGIKAKNSSGTQFLHFDKDEEGLNISLLGEHNDKELQIDFDPLNDKAIDELIGLLTLSKSAQ